MADRPGSRRRATGGGIHGREGVAGWVFTAPMVVVLGVFLFILPANLLSGMLTPVSSMPAWLQPFTLLNPVRYYIEILRAALLEGASFSDLWARVAALAAFGVTILLVSSARFRTRLA